MALSKQIQDEIRIQYESGGTSQRKLAELFGVSRSQIQRAIDPDKDKLAYQRNREARLESARKWRASHPEYRHARNTKTLARKQEDPAYAKMLSKKSREWRIQNLARVMCSSAQHRAKKSGLVFDLTPDDIHIPEFCPVYNVRLNLASEGRSENSPSLDRVDNTRGYLKDNIRVICWAANRDKRSLSASKLLALATYILDHKGCG